MVKQVLLQVERYVENSIDLPPFLIPHTTVPCCLMGVAFWTASFNHGHGFPTLLTALSFLIVGGIFGSIFGISSAITFYSSRKKIKCGS